MSFNCKNKNPKFKFKKSFSYKGDFEFEAGTQYPESMQVCFKHYFESNKTKEVFLKKKKKI